MKTEVRRDNATVHDRRVARVRYKKYCQIGVISFIISVMCFICVMLYSNSIPHWASKYFVGAGTLLYVWDMFVWHMVSKLARDSEKT